MDAASCSALLRASLTAKDDNKTTLWWIWMRWRSAVLPQIFAQLPLLQAALHYKQRAQDCVSRQGKWEGSGKNSVPSQPGWLVAYFDQQRINRLQVTAYVDPRVTASMTARGFRHAVMAR